MTGIPPRTGGETYLSTGQISERYGVHPRTVIRWITTRGLAGVRVGGQWRVAQGAMDDWLTRGRVSPGGGAAACELGSTSP